MWRPRRLGKLVIVGTLVAATFGAGGGRAGITVTGGTPEQRAMARWAIERFWTHGLALPSLEIRFHDDRLPCQGRPGYYEGRVVHICRRRALTVDWAARELLHEMAHGWLEANVTGATRELFLELRLLDTWNDPDARWHERGFEHGAEIVAWALGGQADGTRTPHIPGNSLPELTRGYEVLTGRPLPAVAPADHWVEPAAPH